MNLYPNQYPPDIQLVGTLVSRIFPAAPVRVERVTAGISTYIYRIDYRNETFYLRILPDVGDSFAPEVAVQTRLRQMGVKVPEVIYFEHYTEALQRSVMVTTAIKGCPVSQSSSSGEEKLKAITFEAGGDLARINSIAVEGFGWIERDQANIELLRAEWPAHRAFALEHWQADLDYLGGKVLSASERTMLEQVLARYDSWLDVEQSCLAHGDLDTTHIYQDDGQYTGIIDFGEIRGASRWYDLGHFHMRDGEQLPYRLLSALVQGYGELAWLPPDYEQHIRFTGILINVRALARTLQKRPPNRYTRHQMEVLREDLSALQQETG